MFTQKDLQGMAQLRRALQLFAATLPEDRAREVATVYPQYEVGVAYLVGQYITAGEDGNGDPLLYRVAQDHISQADWPPAETPALYVSLSLEPGSGYPIWVQPAGAYDAYYAGDTVAYGGRLYRSRINGNVWAPDAYPDGWEIVPDSDT